MALLTSRAPTHRTAAFAHRPDSGCRHRRGDRQPEERTGGIIPISAEQHETSYTPYGTRSGDGRTSDSEVACDERCWPSSNPASSAERK